VADSCGDVTFVSETISPVARDSIALLAPRTPRTNEILLSCVRCFAVRLRGGWIAIEASACVVCLVDRLSPPSHDSRHLRAERIAVREAMSRPIAD
jgi:hypothetical protein